MRLLTILFVLLGTLISCTVLKPEGVLINGSVWLVSQQDIHSAIDAARAGEKYPTGPVQGVIVHSRTEMLVDLRSQDGRYPAERIVLGDVRSNYVLVRKENGRWRDCGYSVAFND